MDRGAGRRIRWAACLRLAWFAGACVATACSGGSHGTEPTDGGPPSEDDGTLGDAAHDSPVPSGDSSDAAFLDAPHDGGALHDVLGVLDQEPGDGHSAFDGATVPDAPADVPPQTDAGQDGAPADATIDTSSGPDAAPDATQSDAGPCVDPRTGGVNACSKNTDCCSHICQTLQAGSGDLYTVCALSGASGYCTTNDDCISMNCQNSVCQPSPINGHCAIDSDCSSSLYCSTWVGCCVGRGGSCRVDLDCCDGSCQNGICSASCIYYYSTDMRIQPLCGTHNDCCSDNCTMGSCTPSGLNQPCLSVLDCNTGLNQCTTLHTCAE
jgi:hypothetical protein